MVCGPISYSPRQTFRPYGTVADVERFSTNISSLRDDPLALRLCYKRSVPLGRFPTFYDCATNIPSLWDGSPGSTIVLQTCRPAGTVSCSMIVLHNWSLWDRLV